VTMPASGAGSRWHPIDVENESVLPQRGDPHPSDASLTVRNISIVPEDGKYDVFIATVNYSTPGAQNWMQAAEDPLDDPPQVSIGTWSESKAFYKDLDGKVIKNSADQVYDPSPEREIKWLAFTIRRNRHYSATGADYVDYYKQSTNDAPITLLNFSIGTGEGLIDSYEITGAYRNGVYYWEEAMTILHRQETDNDDGSNAAAKAWYAEYLNIGYVYKDGDNIIPVKSNGEEGADGAYLSLLDANGVPADGNDTPTYSGPFRRYESADWSGLNLGSIEWPPAGA